MSKNNMGLKYKRAKRERNKNIVSNEQNEIKRFIYTTIGVLLFVGLVYLGIIGLEKLGLFEQGYTAPTKEETTIDYEFINIGTVFNRNEKSYYVLFDNYESDYNKNVYIDKLISEQKSYKVYKVDMNKNMNAKYLSDSSNKKATSDSDLRINGLTLIKITNGKISKYLVGETEIKEYLK